MITGFPYDRALPMDRAIAVLSAFLRNPVHGIRRDGSAAIDCSHVAGRTRRRLLGVSPQAVGRRRRNRDHARGRRLGNRHGWQPLDSRVRRNLLRQPHPPRRDARGHHPRIGVAVAIPLTPTRGSVRPLLLGLYVVHAPVSKHLGRSVLTTFDAVGNAHAAVRSAGQARVQRSDCCVLQSVRRDRDALSCTAAYRPSTGRTG